MIVQCLGVPIYAAPANFFNIKKYLVCGGPCYKQCALPLVGSLTKDGAREFTQQFHNAMKAYKAKHPQIANELAVFAS